ncbi:MAG: hypothetical protein ACI4JN_04850, partial [Ruminococcus sp.]
SHQCGIFIVSKRGSIATKFCGLLKFAEFRIISFLTPPPTSLVPLPFQGRHLTRCFLLIADILHIKKLHSTKIQNIKKNVNKKGGGGGYHLNGRCSKVYTQNLNLIFTCIFS